MYQKCAELMTKNTGHITRFAKIIKTCLILLFFFIDIYIFEIKDETD